MGETCQFDWSHERVVIAGVEQVVKVTHFRLSYSQQMFVAAETQEMVLDAHNQAFAFFGGVPKRMVYDNLKTVVDELIVFDPHRSQSLQCAGAMDQPSCLGAFNR